MKWRKVDCVDSEGEQHEINEVCSERGKSSEWIWCEQGLYVEGRQAGVYQEREKEWKKEKTISLKEIQGRKQGTQLGTYSA